MRDDGLGPLTFTEQFERVARHRLFPMLAALDESVNLHIPEHIDSDTAADAVSELEDACAFHYRWAHVILTTAVMDALRSIARFCTAPGAMPIGTAVMPTKTELGRVANVLSQLAGVDVTAYPGGVSVLEGMVLARNKIVHNGGLAAEQGSVFIPIPVEGEPDPLPSTPDPILSHPAYVAAGEIAVSKALFERNAEWCSAFLEWVDGEVVRRTEGHGVGRARSTELLTVSHTTARNFSDQHRDGLIAGLLFRALEEW